MPQITSITRTYARTLEVSHPTTGAPMWIRHAMEATLEGLNEDSNIVAASKFLEEIVRKEVGESSKNECATLAKIRNDNVNQSTDLQNMPKL